jgi:hypothetical protein
MPAKRLNRVCCPANAEDDTGQGAAEDKLSNGDRQHNQRGEQGGEAAYQHNDGAQHPSMGVTDTWLDGPMKLGGETERGHIASAGALSTAHTLTGNDAYMVTPDVAQHPKCTGPELVKAGPGRATP